MYLKLFVGASVAALAAASATAQTTISGTNESTVIHNGSYLRATVSNDAIGNDNNVSRIEQRGEWQSATVEQLGDGNRSRVHQEGSSNQTLHRQRGDGNHAESGQAGGGHYSDVKQGGSNNTSTVIQTGGYINLVYLDQSEAPVEGPGETNGRVASISQNGTSNRADVRQVGSARGAASNNIASVVQGIAILQSFGNRASIDQQSGGNKAEVIAFEGSVYAPNIASITQQGRSDSSSETAASNNRAVIAVRGYHNQGGITQTGRDNFADITMLGGSPPVGLQAQGDGNMSSVGQTGERLTAITSIGSRTPGEGRRNSSRISQNGSEHRALVWQRGVSDQVTIRQSDQTSWLPRADPSRTYLDGSRSHAHADVSQKGSGNRAEISQFGDNFLEATQGFGSGSSIVVSQIDIGDLSISTEPLNVENRARNSAAISQHGDSNLINLDQQAIKATAVLWQKVGSSFNSISVRQGREAANPDGVTAEGAVSVSATVTQSGRHNDSAVIQNGSGQTAKVEQMGSGTAGLANRIQLQQLGAKNSATVRQTGDVGASAAGDPSSGLSGDEFYFAGGARAAEVEILQASSGNEATVEQRGKGQFARVLQTGSDNNASILQTTAATNATAIIRQSGNGNSYSVTQDQAGQYVSISQTGNNNAVTDVVRRTP